MDSSAIVKMILDETGTAAVRRIILGRQLISSRLAVVEVTKAVARVSPGTEVARYLVPITFIDLDPDLAVVAASSGGPLLRALDAIHLASALQVAPAIEAFVTYDVRQGEAAAAVGLRVLSPTDERP